jgi:hypothetical protein
MNRILCLTSVLVALAIVSPWESCLAQQRKNCILEIAMPQLAWGQSGKPTNALSPLKVVVNGHYLNVSAVKNTSNTTLPPQGAQIIENVLFTNHNAPPSSCNSAGPNPFGYIPPYQDVLFTDPQWGGVYQEMVRVVPGGASDHNLYYWRNSFNANGTLMLGIQSPPSPDGTAGPWIMALFDGNGCFLKPLFVSTGVFPPSVPSFNWRATWSRSDPNVFYTTGVSGAWPAIGQLSPNAIYAIHPCAGNMTGTSDPVCSPGTAMAVTKLYRFKPSDPTGANFISTDQPSGPSLSEDGRRIGIVTRASKDQSGDYNWSSLGLANSTTVAANSLHTFDITTNYPPGYCYSLGAVQDTRYIGNQFLVEAAGFRGTQTPACQPSQIAAMQIIDDSSATPNQYGFIAQDQNAPWYNGGGHETWSPYIMDAPKGGYFVYYHVAGGSAYKLSGCTAAANIATCTALNGVLPAWPIGTRVLIRGSSVPMYDGRWSITANTSTSLSWNLGSSPGGGVGGTVSDGNQWEIHSIGLDGTQDVTNFEAVNELSAKAVHSFWPWGSSFNGGTVTDFFYSGFAYNNLSQYPALNLSGCNYTGTAPTGIATCTLATGNVPAKWIVPDNQQGSGTSTPYIYGVSDGIDQCYNGSFAIVGSTAKTFSYQPLCTPGGSGTGGNAYVGATDEIYQCYRGDANYGNSCIPIARTYTDQVTTDFWYEPLLNGTAEGDKVEFDSAPAFLQ